MLITRAWPAAANPGDMTTWMPEIEPIAPEPNSPALNPVEIGVLRVDRCEQRAEQGEVGRVHGEDQSAAATHVAVRRRRGRPQGGGDLGRGRGGVERRAGGRPGEQVGDGGLLGLDGVLATRGRR